jgi:hypothetical protein
MHLYTLLREWLYFGTIVHLLPHLLGPWSTCPVDRGNSRHVYRNS